MPPHASKFFYLLAPFIAVALALVSISIIPFGPEVSVPGGKTLMEVGGLDVGILFILAIGAVSVYGIALAGWSSNNKYSLMGGLRSSAQMISYELPFTLVLVSPLLLANQLSLRGIANSQAGFYFNAIPRWSIFQLPFPQLFGFVIFMIAGFAETNRVPFDLPEAENELVAGFHTEYSSMKFACFFMAEYANMVTVACVATTLFLGGWHPLFPSPYSDWVPTVVFVAAALMLFMQSAKVGRKGDHITFPIFGFGALFLAAVFAIPFLETYLLPIFWFASKAGFLLFVYIWIRGTLPRFRYDQLMHFAWTFMFPCALVNLLLTALMVALFPDQK